MCRFDSAFYQTRVSVATVVYRIQEHTYIDIQKVCCSPGVLQISAPGRRGFFLSTFSLVFVVGNIIFMPISQYTQHCPITRKIDINLLTWLNVLTQYRGLSKNLETGIGNVPWY